LRNLLQLDGIRFENHLMTGMQNEVGASAPGPAAEVFAEGFRLHRAGRLAEAEALYRRAIALDPKSVGSLHNLGVLARQTGRAEAAADLLGRAIALDGRIAALQVNYAVTLRELGRLDEAVAAYRRASEIDPGVAYVHNNLGNILGGQGKFDEAEAAFRRAIDVDPNFAQAHNNLGKALIDQGRADEAVQSLHRAIDLKPDLVEAHHNLGAIYTARKAWALAAAAYQRGVSLDPARAETHYNLAVVLLEQGKLEEAEATYHRLIALEPNRSELHNNLGNILKDRGKLDEAAAAYRRAIALKPDAAEILSNLGNVLKTQGKLDEAVACYERAIAINPDYAEPHYQLARMRPMNDGSAEAETAFANLSRRADDSAGQTPDQRARILFAMAKALEDRGEFDRAFACLAEANTLTRAAMTFDIDETERLAQSIAQVFTPLVINRNPGAGHASERPIFIVGMPRSGSTLVEQILSAHPAVHGAGEIENLAALIAKGRGRGGSLYPAWAGTMTAGDRHKIGQLYLDGLPAGEPGQARLTDKRLNNFAHLGLIRLCLPNARVIHCRRDPRDTGLSAYAIRFTRGQEFTYDLTELGRYWRAYDKLMDHWRSVLPAGWMLEVPYEGVVADLETWARRLIAHCGLEWDDACLRFHQSGREVRTASSVQVRRPIYTGSVGRWRPFARHLGPLLDALGEPWSNIDFPGPAPAGARFSTNERPES
jgi:tetratricopeptide (TPR) repeat protein